jgi:hypothetical protein
MSADRRRWRIHTGPFPYVSPDVDGEMWLWRVTDDRHFTSITVRIGRPVLDAGEGSLDVATRRCLVSRGQAAVEACLTWREPPREICFDLPTAGPVYWRGRR